MPCVAHCTPLFPTMQPNCHLLSHFGCQPGDDSPNRRLALGIGVIGAIVGGESAVHARLQIRHLGWSLHLEGAPAAVPSEACALGAAGGGRAADRS